jgi:glycosyltransferase involved in cell wall biosynthesis
MKKLFQRKKRVLIFGDYNCTTGFSTVVTNILRQLQNHFAGQVQFDVVAINWYGDKLSDDYEIKQSEGGDIKIVEEYVDGKLAKVKKRIKKTEGKDTVVYSAYYHDESIDAAGNRDLFGRNAMLSMLKHFDYNLLFAVQDIGVMADVFQVIKTIKQEKKLTNRKQTKVLYYFPLDGALIPSWFDHFDAVDRLIAYTNYAKEQALSVRPDLKMSVILHGINTAQFTPLSEQDRINFRTAFFGEHADKFIISNINRNQHRKDIPSTIFAFKKFRTYCPNSFLYLHMDPADIQGWNLKVVMEQTGLKNNEDYMFTPPDLIANPPDPGFINCLYNASDVYFTTTNGEGFGLTILEAMMAKIPVVAPYNTSIKEISAINKVVESSSVEQIIGDRGRLLTYKSEKPIVSRFDNMIRTQADIETALNCLYITYRHWKHDLNDTELTQLEAMIDRAHAYARSLSWNGIGRQWIQEVRQLL